MYSTLSLCIIDRRVVKFDSAGHIQWDKTIDRSSNDALKSIQEVKRNEYVLTGESSSDISGDKTMRSLSQTRWLLDLKYKKEDNAVGSAPFAFSSRQSKEGNRERFTIYPNPATNKFDMQSAGKTLFILTDEWGEIVLSKTINGSGVIYLSCIQADNITWKTSLSGLRKNRRSKVG